MTTNASNDKRNKKDTAFKLLAQWQHVETSLHTDKRANNKQWQPTANSQIMAL